MSVLAPGLSWIDLNLARELNRHLTGDQIPPHRVGAPFEVSWQGLARYWRKKSG
jgi:hypothetical protein